MAKKAYIGVDGTARKVKKGYVGVYTVPKKQYAMLEYIQGTGTQYITTGTPINESYTVEMKANIQQVTGSLYGLIGNWGTMSCTLYSNNFRFFWYSGCSDWSPTLNTDYVIKHTPSAVYINGSTLNKSSDNNSGSGNFSVLNANNGIGKAKLYYFRVYASDGTTLIADYLPCKRLSDGAVGLYDNVERKFYSNSGTGKFTVGTETGEYIYDIPAEGEFAHRIKKAYIGIGGVARPFWSGGDVAYYGTVTPLSAARIPAAVDVGDYIIFAGGSGANWASEYSVVDAYDKSLVRTTAASLRTARRNHGATKAGKYGLICGGRNANSGFTDVDAYDENLVRTAAASLSGTTVNCGTARNRNYGLIGGGASGNYLSRVDAYDGTLTKTVCTALSVAASAPSGSGVGQYAVFAGGLCISSSYYPSKYVDAYGEDLTKVVAADLSIARSDLGGAGNGKYAVFAGGYVPNSNLTATTLKNNVDAYDSDLTRGTAEALSIARGSLACSDLGENAIFAGGNSSSGASNAADIYNTELTRRSDLSLTTARVRLKAASNGDLALFGGGALDGDVTAVSNAVDVFTIT